MSTMTVTTSVSLHTLTDSPFFSSIDMVCLSVILAEPSVVPAVLKVTPSLVQEIVIESPNWDRSLQMRWNSAEAMLTTTLGAVSWVNKGKIVVGYRWHYYTKLQRGVYITRYALHIYTTHPFNMAVRFELTGMAKCSTSMSISLMSNVATLSASGYTCGKETSIKTTLCTHS